jgi:hypothetical protein
LDGQSTFWVKNLWWLNLHYQNHLTANTNPEFRSRRLLPVGPAYLAHARRVLGNKTFAEEDEEEALKIANGAEDDAEGLIKDDLGVGDEPETPDLLLLDPKDWKVGILMRGKSSYSMHH